MMDLRQLNYNQRQNNYNLNVIDLLQIQQLQITYNLVNYFDYSSINFMNHYLIFRNYQYLRNDLLYIDIEKNLNPLCFKQYKDLTSYYQDLKNITIRDKKLIDPKYYKFFNIKIEFINQCIKNKFSISKNQLKILNNYIDSLNWINIFLEGVLNVCKKL